MTCRLRRVSALFLVGILCSTVAGAQTAGVTLNGTVTDETGAPLPGAMVTATNTATGFTRSATTVDAGRYTVLGLVAGMYDVRVELQAFTTIVQKAQEFQVGQTVTLDFKLKLGSLAETIEVTAETPVVQTDSSQLARVIRADELDSQGTLNRNFTDLASFAPGVSVAGNNVTIGNGPTVGTGFLVDGSSLQEPTVGGAAFQISQDWIQEFSVLVGQFPAEFGAAQNGVLNAVTRSGTNKLHGRASGYFQTDKLNATQFGATSKLPFNQQRVGVDIGGPIQKDKMFYFFGYELNRAVTTSPVSVPTFLAGVVPGLTVNAAGTAAEGANENVAPVHSIIAKVDYRVGNAHTFTPRLLYVKTDASSRGGTALTSTRWSSRGFTDQLNDAYQLAWDWVASSKSLLDTRVAYRRLGTGTGCFSAEDQGLPFIMTLTTLMNPAISFPAPNNNITLGCTGPWGHRYEREFSINEAYSRTTGAHQFKVGGMVMYASHFAYEQQNQAGAYTMGSATSFLNEAVPATYPTAYTLNFAPGDSPYWHIGGGQYSAFAQDTWRIGTNLTLNYGLRWDMDAKLPSANEYVDLMRAPYNTSLNHINTQKDEFAPRFGFTWAPTKSKQLAVRGGFGVFYDESHNGTLAGWSGQIGNPFAPGGLVQTLQNNSATANPYCAGNNLCAAGVPAAFNTALRQVLAFALLTHTAPNFSAKSVTLNGVTTPLPPLTLVPTPLSVGHIAEDIRTPYQRQATIGVQANFGHGFDGSADFKIIQGRDQYMRRNINTNLQGGVIDPLYLARFELGNGGELDVKQLLATFNYRSRKGHQAAAVYALGWAKSNSIQDFSNGAGASGGVTNPLDYSASLDYGPTSNDVRHVLNMSATVQLPYDIAFSPIFRIQSALPFAVTTAGRPTPAQGCEVYYTQCYAFNSTTGEIVARNSVRGDVTWNVNARLSKAVNLGFGRSLTLFAEAYNLTNRENITGYSGLTNVGNATGGVITGLTPVPNAAQTMRQIQLGARFDF